MVIVTVKVSIEIAQNKSTLSRVLIRFRLLRLIFIPHHLSCIRNRTTGTKHNRVKYSDCNKSNYLYQFHFPQSSPTMPAIMVAISRAITKRDEIISSVISSAFIVLFMCIG